MFKRNFFKIYVLFWFITGCKISYKTYEFEKAPEIKKPDYSKSESWAVIPGKIPNIISDFYDENKEIKDADVFFIYPTLIDGKDLKAWNSDIWDRYIRNDILNRPVKYQASAWIESGNLYVPYYRQAHLRVFNEKFETDGKKALDLAYSDIRDAFIYFIDNYNRGRPFIIASHSQGTFHAKRLITEFIDGKKIQKKLIAAYLVGWKVDPDEFDYLKPMTSPDETGGFVAWNTYKINKYPRKNTYEELFRGGVTSNPITWDKSTETDISLHKGLLYTNLKIFPKSLNIKLIDGMIWSTVPNLPGKLFFSTIKDYHFADINLFWVDIRENAKLRVKQWFLKNNY